MFALPGAGLTITDACADVCTFSAIVPGDPYRIDGSRCDECGNCWNVCPAGAIRHKAEA